MSEPIGARKALVIAGGLATRLRPLTDRIPKGLLPIANRPFLEHQVALLARHGVDEVVLLTGHLAEDFGAFAAAMGRYGVRLEVVTEAKPLGTAGAVRSQLERLDGTTLVLNGDVLTDVDVSALLRQHAGTRAAITMYLTFVPDSSSFGVVPVDADGRVQAFLQNPRDGGPMPGDWINAGIYALEPGALEEVPAETEWSFEYQLFPSVLARGEPFYGFRSDAYWLDIGNPARYLQAHVDVLEGRTRAQPEGRILRDDVELPDGTRVRAPSLLAHAPVGAGSVIGPLTCLGPGAEVGPGCVVERSVVHAGARVGARAVLRGSIVGRNAEVPEGAVLEDAVVA